MCPIGDGSSFTVPVTGDYLITGDYLMMWSVSVISIGYEQQAVPHSQGVGVGAILYKEATVITE